MAEPQVHTATYTRTCQFRVQDSDGYNVTVGDLAGFLKQALSDGVTGSTSVAVTQDRPSSYVFQVTFTAKSDVDLLQGDEAAAIAAAQALAEALAGVPDGEDEPF